MIRVRPRSPVLDAVEVTFTVPAHGLAGPIFVVGDFNDWDPTAAPLSRYGARYRGVVAIEIGRRYAYRYRAAGTARLDDAAWFNDDAPDDYQPNTHGGFDSVLDLRGPRPVDRPATARVTARARATRAPARWAAPRTALSTG